MSLPRTYPPKTVHENQVDMFWIDWEIPESLKALFRDALGSDFQPFVHVEAVVQGWSTPGSYEEAGDSEFWISESWIDISTGDDLRMDLAPGHPLHEAILEHYGDEIIEHAFS